jgi:hypothetical protein
MRIKAFMKTVLVSLVAFGLLAVVANAQPELKKKYTYKIDKRKVSFVTPTLDLSPGKIKLTGVVKGVDVSGGAGGCYTVTVTTYRLTPNGVRVAVSSKSKRICGLDRLPELVVDRIPRGKYAFEVVIDRPLVNREKIEGELQIEILPERNNLQ